MVSRCSAQDYIASWPDADSAGSLQWAPAFAGASRSGDLGFTTGPYEAAGGGGGVSEAGDLGWTYGYADWREAEETRRAGYLRIWQRQGDDWKVVIDNLAPFPPR
jgi:hypothetical protein